MSIRFLWDFVVFRLVAYLLNMICLNLLFLYQNCIYIYEFSCKFDKVFYQYLETWTSDITFMGRDQEPKWLLAFSIYPLSFFLYGPLKIKGEDKGAHGKDRCMIRTSSSITWNIFSYEILCTVYLQVEFKTGLLYTRMNSLNQNLGDIERIYKMSSWQFFNGFYTSLPNYHYILKK